MCVSKQPCICSGACATKLTFSGICNFPLIKLTNRNSSASNPKESEDYAAINKLNTFKFYFKLEVSTLIKDKCEVLTSRVPLNLSLLCLVRG